MSGVRDGYRVVRSIAADRAGNLSFILYGGDEFLEYVTFFAILKLSPEGVITTVVRNGKWGYSGDGGPAIDAGISPSVDSLAVDGAGNLFIADYVRIRKVSADGVIVTVAGNGVYRRDPGDGGPATSALVNDPHAVAADGQGNLFILESERIRRVSPSGIISTAAVLGPCDYSDSGQATIGTQILRRAGRYGCGRRGQPLHHG